MSEIPANEIDIATAAAAPRRVQGDAGEVEQHSLADQIEADRHLARKAAGRNPFNAFKNNLGTIAAPGAI